MDELKIRDKLTELGFIIKRFNTKKWNRCSTVHNPNKKNGWYVVNSFGVNYGDWNNCIEQGFFWNDDFNQKTEIEKIKIMEEQREIQKILEVEEKKARILEVNGTYHICKSITELHPYLVKKQCRNQIDFRLDNKNRLVIPMYNVDKVLCGYQYIDAEGKKMFKSGSICKGAFYPIKPSQLKIEDLDVIYLCEGYATADSIYQALNNEFTSFQYGVLACFSASNIDNVANALTDIYPRFNIIAIQDQDEAGVSCKTNGFTVGITKGEDANDIFIKFGGETLARLIHEKTKYIFG